MSRPGVVMWRCTRRQGSCGVSCRADAAKAAAAKAAKEKHKNRKLLTFAEDEEEEEGEGGSGPAPALKIRSYHDAVQDSRCAVLGLVA